MNTRFASFLVAAAGLVCFAGGVVLRFHAADLGVAALRSSDYFAAAALSSQAGVTYDIALPLLWLGGALVFLAALVLLRAVSFRSTLFAGATHHPAL